MNGATAAPGDLVAEHCALVRHLARLQVRISTLVADHACERNRLEAQVLRLQAQNVIAATRMFWNVRDGATPVASVSAPASDAPIGDIAEARVAPGGAEGSTESVPVACPQARAVLCATACQGHAHPWLEENRCRLLGEPCERGARLAPRR